MLISSCVWAYVIGAVCRIVYSMDLEQMVFDERMDAFNRMAAQNEIPLPLRYRAREYLRASRFHMQYLRSIEANDSLSKGLRASIAKHMAMHYLGGIKLIAACSSPCRQAIAGLLKPHFFERQERIDLFGHICVIERGTVIRGGTVYAQGGNWGLDMIMSLESLWQRLPVKCLTHTEILTLGRQDLFDIVQRHPEEMRRFRRAAACLALRRVVTIYHSEKRSGIFLPETEWIHRLFHSSRSWSHEVQA